MSKYSKLCELRRAVENFCYDFIPKDKNISNLSKEERKAYSKAISLLDKLDDALIPYEEVFRNREDFMSHCYKLLFNGIKLSPEETDLFWECAPKMYFSEEEYNFILDMLNEEE